MSLPEYIAYIERKLVATQGALNRYKKTCEAMESQIKWLQDQLASKESALNYQTGLDESGERYK